MSTRSQARAHSVAAVLLAIVAPAAKPAALPPGQSIIREHDLAAFQIRRGAEVLRTQVVPVEGMPFREALRMEKTRAPGEADAETGPAMDAADLRVGKSTNFFQVEARSVIPVRSGDWALISFQGRALAAADTNRGARLGVTFRFAAPPGGASMSREARLGPAWQRFDYAFQLVIKNKLDRQHKNDAEAGTQCVQFTLDGPPMTVEVADVRCLDYGPNATYAELPHTPVTYAGREPDAPWRKAAAARIEQIRKGDLAVTVTRGGQPVAGAAVQVDMRRHAFGFGTAVAALRLLRDKTSDGERYRREFLKHFNSATPEAGLMMSSWWHRPEGQTEAIDTVNWLLDHGVDVHGHALVYPSWRHNAKEMKSLAGNPEALRKTIDAHIRDIVGRTRGGVDFWIVANEVWASHEFTDLLGDDALAGWFRLAHEVNPAARLFLNDNRILGVNEENMDSPKHHWYEKTIQSLLDAGAPIHGIGMQGHCSWDNFLPPADVVRVLDRLGRLNLELAVTEFGFYVNDEALQGDYVRDYCTAVFSHPKVTGLSMWGFWDGQHHAYNAPLFRKDWTLKPSGKAYEDLVLHQWWTRTNGTTDAAGGYRARGFLGDYAVTATDGGVTRTASVSLARTGTAVTIALDAPNPPEPSYRRPPLPAEAPAASGSPPAGPVLTNRQARVDLKAPDGVELEALGVTGPARWTDPVWIADPAQRKGFLSASADLSAAEWRTFTLRFRSKADGEIDLKLKGQFDKQNTIWVLYDNVRAEGATLVNGDFKSGKKKPDGWKLPVAKGAEWVRAKGSAASGATCVKVSQDAYAAQSIAVKKGQDVAITIAAKLAGVMGK